jgi:UDP-N-acetylglucosamine 1-carboxyvinyltransferase
MLAVTGGVPLRGEVRAQGGKNAALPLIAAGLLFTEPVLLRGVPRLRDTLGMLDLVGRLGVTHSWPGDGDLLLDGSGANETCAPSELVSRMRASFVVLGALLARHGRATVGVPGGCNLGPRPVDRHLKALNEIGLTVAIEGGETQAARSAPLRGRAVFEAPTVGGTQNVILASVLGDSDIVIENAALEPEVGDLCACLNTLGARIEGAGTSTLRIRGVRALHGGEHRVLPDRIETGTLLIAAAATRGDLVVTGARSDHVRALLEKLSEAGAEIGEPAPDAVRVRAPRPLQAIRLHATEYPGFPTDLAPQMAALAAVAEGTSVISDGVYPGRYTHLLGLTLFGGRMEVRGHALVVDGAGLRGAAVEAPDIRAGAALVIGALAAEGVSTIANLRVIERGYQELDLRLRELGAEVERIELVSARIPITGD